MNHTLVPGIEPSSVILSQTKNCEKIVSKYDRQVQAIRDSVIKQKITYIFYLLKNGKFLCILNSTNHLKSTIILCYKRPWVPLVQQQWHTPDGWNTKRDFSFGRYAILRYDWMNNMDHTRNERWCPVYEEVSMFPIWLAVLAVYTQ